MARSTRRRRIPQSLRDGVDILIRRVAAELRIANPETYTARGLRNDEIVTAAQLGAEALFARHFKEAVADWLGVRVPIVMGKRAIDATHSFQPCIPELGLPEWVNVPAEIGSGWKRERDATPNQLQRVIDHREDVIRGHEIERDKYVLLRNTAIRMGCDFNVPIASVFFPDDGKPSRDGERPIIRP